MSTLPTRSESSKSRCSEKAEAAAGRILDAFRSGNLPKAPDECREASETRSFASVRCSESTSLREIPFSLAATFKLCRSWSSSRK